MSSEKVRASRSDLKAARVRLGLSQAQLAKVAGISREALIAFERGKTEAYDSTWEAIQSAIESRGIVFTNGDKPGYYFDKNKVIVPTT